MPIRLCLPVSGGRSVRALGAGGGGRFVPLSTTLMPRAAAAALAAARPFGPALLTGRLSLKLVPCAGLLGGLLLAIVILEARLPPAAAVHAVALMAAKGLRLLMIGLVGMLRLRLEGEILLFLLILVRPVAEIVLRPGLSFIHGLGRHEQAVIMFRVLIIILSHDAIAR